MDMYVICYFADMGFQFNLLFVFFVAEIYALSSNDIKVGTNIEVDGSPWRVIGTTHLCLSFNFI